MIFKIFSLKAIEQRIYRFILQTTNKNNKKVFILCIVIENIVKHMFLIPEGVVLLIRTSKYTLRFKKKSQVRVHCLLYTNLNLH